MISSIANLRFEAAATRITSFSLDVATFIDKKVTQANKIMLKI